MGQCWKLPWASTDTEAGARGHAEPALEARALKRWGGTHSCRKLCCCLPAVHSGKAVVLAQGPYGWTQHNSLGSVEGPLTPGQMLESSRASASVQFLALAVLWQLEVLWQDLLTVMLLTLMCPRNFWLCIQPHLCSTVQRQPKPKKACVLEVQGIVLGLRNSSLLILADTYSSCAFPCMWIKPRGPTRGHCFQSLVSANGAVF